MALLNKGKAAQTPELPPQAAACEQELGRIGQKMQEVYLKIGRRYAAKFTLQEAAGTPFEADLREIAGLEARKILLEKRRLAVQGLRNCESCGNTLALDSAFCNKCGGKLEPLEPEVLTDGPLCPQCKSPVEPGSGFCIKCGAKLTASSESAQVAGTAQLICPDCGTVCEIGTSFCFNCGRALGS